MTGPTTEPPVVDSFASLLDRARTLVEAGGRRIVGVAGSPGAGKTTLATAVVRALNASGRPGEADWAVHVPMDGFHLADRELARLGRLQRKGAPDTFDAAGYAALLERLRRDTHQVVYAPAFDRDIEQPIAGTIPVGPGCRLVVTEGNYLLLDDEPWPLARAQLDEVWFCRVDHDVRRRRLVDRHVRFGKPAPAAEAWVEQVDELNARRIETSRIAADLVVTGEALEAAHTV
jgi:pantothenate kinase